MTSRQLDEEAIFHLARKIPDPEDRATYLGQICAGDQALRERVEDLLHVHEREQHFLKSSPEPAATVEHSPISEGPGQQIGRYKLLQKIGEGGFGVVYMAEQERPLRRNVALKIIKPGMDTQAVVARFEAERQALALMDHPNISKVLDGGATDSGRPYFVMELVRGVPITEYCDKNMLSTQDRLGLFNAVCQAVQHAHQKGIIHRDLKPSNILITLHDGQPVVKVIDFGVAKAINQQLTEKTLFTAFGQMVGTPQYMSPEQAEMSGLDVDTRSDVYSIGVVLYELLTGTTPIDGDRLRTAGYAEMQRIIREEEPPKPSTRLSTAGDQLTIIAKHRGLSPERLHKSIRGDLDWIVMKALEKDRSRRYDTANALDADVNRFLNGEAIDARPPSTVYRLQKAALRHRAALATTLLVAFSLLAGIVSSSWLAVHWKHAMDDAVVQKEKATTAQADLQEAVSLLHDELRDVSMAAVMSGDEERARAAIARAKAADLSESWLNILRGQLALYSGKPDEAIQFLKPEAPRSVAAESMLALAYFYSGRLEESAFTMMNASRRTPETPEDDLFAGQALIVYEPQEAIERIRVALEKRNSPLGRMILAYALANIALDTGSQNSAELALREAEAARCFLGETPIMLSTHLFVRHVAIKTGHLEFSDHLLAEAQGMARDLASLPFGRLELAWFFEDFGDLESANRLWTGAERISGYEAITYISCLLRSTPPAEVLDVIARRVDSGDLYTQCNKAGIMALIPAMHDEARRVCEEQLRRPGSYDVRNVFLIVLLLLGQSDDAQRMAQKLLDTSRLPFRYQKEAMQYTAGEISAEQLIQGAGTSRVNQTAAFMQLAMTELANGHRKEAEAYFRKCAEVGLFVDGNYWWSKRYLEIMADDPKWPRWIRMTTTQ